MAERRSTRAACFRRWKKPNSRTCSGFAVEAVEDRVASISFIAALPDAEREAVLEQVRELVERELAIRAESRIDFPYRTDVYTCRRI